jgi:hypothetical protein
VTDVNRLLRQMLTDEYIEEYGVVANTHATYQTESHFLRPGPHADLLMSGRAEEMGMTFRQKVNSHTATHQATAAAGAAASAIVPFLETQPSSREVAHASGASKPTRYKIQPLVLASSSGSSARLAKTSLVTYQGSSSRGHSPITGGPAHHPSVVYTVDDDDDLSVRAQPKTIRPHPKKKEKKAASAGSGAAAGIGGGADQSIDVIELSSDEEESDDQESEEDTHRAAAPARPPPSRAPVQRKKPAKQTPQQARGSMAPIFHTVRAPSSSAAAPRRSAAAASPRTAQLAKAHAITPTSVSTDEEMEVESIEESQTMRANAGQDQNDQQEFAPDDLVRGPHTTTTQRTEDVGVNDHTWYEVSLGSSC